MDRLEKTRAWAWMLKEIRSFLDERGYLEVTTPCVVPAGAFESSIDPLSVTGRDWTAQLQTSPEMEMKAVLADARVPVYQIAPAFRDDPPSPHHRREFTMLEFYRLGAECRPVQADTMLLIERVCGRALPWRTPQVGDLFRILGLELSECLTAGEFRAEIDRLKLATTTDGDSWSDLFFRVWLEKIEPTFDPNVPTLVDGYPLAVSPLSRARGTGPFAERFEIYWQGMELCNGCSELLDPATLERRWDDENAQRRARGVSPHPFPVRLHDAMKKGLPPSAGVAVGLDRLFLALAKTRWDHTGSALID